MSAYATRAPRAEREAKLKRCPSCKSRRPRHEFNKGTNKDGLQSWCRRCVRRLRRGVIPMDRDELRDRWLSEHRQDQAATRLMHKHGLLPEQYQALIEFQGYACAICRDQVPLQVDHDHACCPGKRSCGLCVRGLLCRPCNQGLGSFYDDAQRLRQALSYLHR